MATFPSLSPATRTFTPGEYPYTHYQTYSGINRRVLHTSAMRASQLRCSFVAITEASMLSILSHYQGQLGDFLPFPVPADLLSGFTPASFHVAGSIWRYMEPPQVVDRCGSLFDVSISLESVAAESVTVQGAVLTLALSITPGAATASSVAPGADLTLTLSLDAGAATAS